MGPEGGMGTCGLGGVSNVDGVVLREGGWRPGDVIALVLTGSWAKEEDGHAQKWADNSLLEGGDDAGMDSSVHKSVFDGIEAVGEDIVVPCETHVAGYHERRLVCLSSR